MPVRDGRAIAALTSTSGRSLREIADFIEERTTEFRDSILKRPVRK
jgi:hypothetical protein